MAFQCQDMFGTEDSNGSNRFCFNELIFSQSPEAENSFVLNCD